MPPFSGREPWPQDLEVLILIPAASHSAANRSKYMLKVLALMKPSGQHHPQKAEMKSCGFPNRTPSGPWLRLEILSIKIMNRTGDKGQPCRSPTCTGNRSDLLPAMRTKLLLRSYRDRTALSKGSPDPILAEHPHRIPRGTRSNAFSRSTKHMWTGWANSHKPSSTLWRV
ncbi:hypothetical protein L3Q82_003291 [Scortum barcoo]|uniref:Uncharacterized protein n=1 Tax=Scortum barcoo TaxID=214431 RepID=A0ACB8VM28_9TELE|nr:hypothetical protein L3Q82_003291 [Scortum barcoo]